MSGINNLMRQNGIRIQKKNYTKIASGQFSKNLEEKIETEEILFLNNIVNNKTSINVLSVSCQLSNSAETNSVRQVYS